MRTKFTETEIEMIDEMISFPGVYNLTPKGVECAKVILEKMKKINTEEE